MEPALGFAAFGKALALHKSDRTAAIEELDRLEERRLALTRAQAAKVELMS